MLLNLTTLLNKLIIDNMSTPAQKLKIVLDYLLDQNATLHEKYIEALSNDKADKEAIKEANLDKEASVAALGASNVVLTEVKDELVKAKEDYLELQVKYDQLVSQISLTDKQKQDEIDELYATLQFYIDKLPQNINVEVTPIKLPLVITEVEAEAPAVEEEEIKVETLIEEAVLEPVVETEVVTEITAPEVEDILVVTETVSTSVEEVQEVTNTPAEAILAQVDSTVEVV
jgi:hypothetical protein